MKTAIHLGEASDESYLLELLKELPADIFVGAEALIDSSYSHVLHFDQAGLALSTNTLLDSATVAAPTRVDFLDAGLRHRRQTSGKSQGIAKAVGLNKREGLTVLDTTAGLGKDAFILSSLGCSITMLERSPIVHALLKDGFRRGLLSGDGEVIDVLGRMTLFYCDALSWFEKILGGNIEAPDVIYLDPMFPSRGKSAKVKKDISLLQQILGIDDDFDELLAGARLCAKQRVVVKRPGRKSKNASPKPAFQIAGKSAHFDVFV